MSLSTDCMGKMGGASPSADLSDLDLFQKEDQGVTELPLFECYLAPQYWKDFHG